MNCCFYSVRLPRRFSRPFAFSSLRGGVNLFWITLSLLLAFYALALVHEVIPGLCLEDTQAE